MSETDGKYPESLEFLRQWESNGAEEQDEDGWNEMHTEGNSALNKWKRVNGKSEANGKLEELSKRVKDERLNKNFRRCLKRRTMEILSK